MCFLEPFVCNCVVVAADVDECIECSLCRSSGKSHAGESSDDILSAFLKLLPHGFNARLVSGKSGNPSPLGEGRNISNGVLHDFIHVRDNRRWSGQISETPSGHGECFGESVNGNSSLGHIRKRADGDMPFEVDVYEYVAKRKPQIMLNDLDDAGIFSGDFPYYLYLAYRGETFVEGWDVSAFDLRQGSIHYLYEGEEIEPRYRDFMSLTEEHLPEFYVYTVSVALPFPYITELQETVVLDKLDVTIGDEVYEAKLGRVRVLPQDAFPSDARVVDHDSVRINTGQLYNDGIILLCDVFDLTEIFDMEAVPEDITITGLRIVEEATQILDINVYMNSGGQYMEMQWDGVSPIYLYKGDSISIEVTARNEYAGKLLNYVVSHVIVEYTNSANEQLCFVSSQQCTGSPINYEYYAIIFDGLDMEPYYRNYFYKTTFQWVDEYRGK